MLNRHMRDVVRGQHVLTVRPSDDIETVAKAMKRAHVAAVLVTDPVHDLMGIFTERDLVDRVVAEGLVPRDTAVGDTMTPNPITIRGESTVRDALHKMYSAEVRHMPVTQDNRVIGIVSIRDFISDEISEFDHERAFARRIWETLA